MRISDWSSDVCSSDLLDRRSSDVHAGDRTKQAAVYAGFLQDGDGLTGQFFADSLCGGQLLGLNFFEFGAARFEFFQGGFGRTTGDFLGNQVIAGIAVAPPNDRPKIYTLATFFDEKNFHKTT